MIVKSLALANSKAIMIQEQTLNLTSSKQKDAERHFRQDYYVPPDNTFEITDKVDMQKTINNSEQKINNQSVIQPRRSMTKQIQLWNHMNDSRQKLKIITDDYYHESIAVTTSKFLQNMRQVVIECQEKIRKKRTELVSDTTAAIRKEWDYLRASLTNIVSNWCKKSEEEEISLFLEKGEVFSSGPLAELAARLANKKEEIELYFSRVSDLYKNNRILKGEDLTTHMFQIKSYLKEIWDKHYQFEVQELDLNVTSYVEQIQSLPYYFQEGAGMRDILHRSIDDSLAQFSIFQSFFQKFYKREEQKASIALSRREEGSVRKNLSQNRSRDIVVESFIGETMRELQIIKAERDKEWKELTQKKR